MRGDRERFDLTVGRLPRRLSDEDRNEPEKIAGLVERSPGRRRWRVLYDPQHYDEHGRATEDHARRDDAPSDGGAGSSSAATSP